MKKIKSFLYFGLIALFSFFAFGKNVFALLSNTNLIINYEDYANIFTTEEMTNLENLYNLAKDKNNNIIIQAMKFLHAGGLTYYYVAIFDETYSPSITGIPTYFQWSESNKNIMYYTDSSTFNSCKQNYWSTTSRYYTYNGAVDLINNYGNADLSNMSIYPSNEPSNCLNLPISSGGNLTLQNYINYGTNVNYLDTSLYTTSSNEKAIQFLYYNNSNIKLIYKTWTTSFEKLIIDGVEIKEGDTIPSYKDWEESQVPVDDGTIKLETVDFHLYNDTATYSRTGIISFNAAFPSLTATASPIIYAEKTENEVMSWVDISSTNEISCTFNYTLGIGTHTAFNYNLNCSLSELIRSQYNKFYISYDLKNNNRLGVSNYLTSSDNASHILNHKKGTITSMYIIDKEQTLYTKPELEKDFYFLGENAISTSIITSKINLFNYNWRYFNQVNATNDIIFYINPLIDNITEQSTINVRFFPNTKFSYGKFENDQHIGKIIDENGNITDGTKPINIGDYADDSLNYYLDYAKNWLSEQNSSIVIIKEKMQSIYDKLPDTLKVPLYIIIIITMVYSFIRKAED